MVKVQEGLLLILSSRNSLCTVFSVEGIVSQLRKFLEENHHRKAEKLYVQNEFIATHLFSNVNDMVIKRSSASTCLSYFGVASRMAFHGSLGSLLTVHEDSAYCEDSRCVEVCPDETIGHHSQVWDCTEHCRGGRKLFLSRDNGVIEVYRI